jgi:Protein of unknown function (DUF2934)/Polyketide cyclase / dehydrase and lipid transport
MGATTHSLEVNASVGAVYGQWTQFEEFPRFMEGVIEIQRHDAKRLLWKVNIGGKDKEWEAEILEQIPDSRIVWESVDGTQNRGIIAFEPLDLDRTLITLTMEYEPEGFLERAGDALGIPSSQVEGNLKRFRDFIERREMENGTLADQRDEGVINGDRTGVSGSGPFSPIPIHSEEIVAPTEQEEEIKNPEPVGHSSLLSGEPATEFLPEEAPVAPLAKTEEERSEVYREAEALPPTLAEEVEGTKKTQPIGHSSLLSAETAPESFPEEATLAPLPKDEEGHSEFYRDAGVLSPTSEQIAQRAYELYLARGSVHGHEREDWLEAEKQLRASSEKH